MRIEQTVVFHGEKRRACLFLAHCHPTSLGEKEHPSCTRSILVRSSRLGFNPGHSPHISTLTRFAASETPLKQQKPSLRKRLVGREGEIALMPSLLQLHRALSSRLVLFALPRFGSEKTSRVRPSVHTKT
jgi:hypothetical protein